MTDFRIQMRDVTGLGRCGGAYRLARDNGWNCGHWHTLETLPTCIRKQLRRFARARA